jgi:hypothetical protein
LAAAAIELGLVDELRMFGNPVVVGDGTPFLPPATEEHPSQHAVEWHIKRQDLRIHNRPNRHDQEVGAETDHHERQHKTSCDDAQQCRNQSIVSSPDVAKSGAPSRRSVSSPQAVR